MSDEKIVYKDQEPKVPFPLKCYGKETELRFAHLINTVAENSPIGLAVMEAAFKEGYSLQMVSATGWSGTVIPEAKMIYLNPLAEDAALVNTLVHECRHVEQYAKGLPTSHHEYNLKDAIKISRAKEADAEATSTAACYEIMVNTGIDGPWLAQKEKTPKITGGLMAAVPYESSPVTTEMLQGAFDGWFQNPKIIETYENTILMTQCLDNSLSTWRNLKVEDYFQKQMSSKEIVTSICTDAKGKCYWSNNPDVLDRPTCLEVSEKVFEKAKFVNNARNKEYGLKQDKSYLDLPIRGHKPKEVLKTADKAVPAVVLAQKTRGR